MKKMISRSAPALMAAVALSSGGYSNPASAQDGVIRIGVSLRMIVENGLRYGQMTKDELEGVNATGGINGKKVEVILLDDECKPDKGIANVNRFINQNKVHLVIGSTCSSVSLPLVDITAKEEVPQIIPHSTNTGITKKGSAWVFRTSVSERFSASIHGKWLSENVGKKVAYLYTNDGAGIGFAKDYMSFMRKNYNVEPVYEAQMQESDLDFRAHLLKIKSLGVEVLAIGGQLDAIARIAQQSIEVGIPKKVRRISASAASNAPVPELAGGHHEKMDGTGYPKRLARDQMSVQARIMAIADIFEALTAIDRPYKKGKMLSEAIKIMSFMNKDQHIDPDLFELFLTSGVYKEYATRFLKPEFIDEVDISVYLKQPQPASS